MSMSATSLVSFCLVLATSQMSEATVTPTSRMNTFKAFDAELAPPLRGAKNPGNWSLDAYKLRPSGNVVNGGDAATGQIPFQVSLLIYYSDSQSWFHVCGGSLLSSTKVLTAAHCLNNGGRPRAVLMGFSDFDNIGSRADFISVSEVAIHPENENFSIFKADVAVLTLAEPAVLSPYINVIRLAELFDGFWFQTCQVSGWGSLSGGGRAARTLQVTSLSSMSTLQCLYEWYARTNRIYIQTYNICTPTTVASPCSGDSGGPLVCNGRVTGIVSWGDGQCATRTDNVPSVYTRVYAYKRWVEQQLRL